MKKILFFVLLSCSLYSQNYNEVIDSIEKLTILGDSKLVLSYSKKNINNFSNDEKAEILLKQFLSQYRINKHESLKYLWKCKKKYSDSTKTKLNYFLGYTHNSLKNYDSAFFYLKKSLKTNSDQYEFLGKTHKTLGHLFNSIGKFDLGLTHFKKAENIFLKNLDSLRLLLVYNEISNYYAAELNTDSSFFYLKKATDIQINHRAKGISYVNIGVIYHGIKNNIDSATYYFNKAQEYNLSDNVLTSLYINKAIVEIKRGKIKNAIEFYEKSKNLAIKTKNLDIQLFIQKDLANLFEEKHDYKKALYHLKNSIPLKD